MSKLVAIIFCVVFAFTGKMFADPKHDLMHKLTRPSMAEVLNSYGNPAIVITEPSNKYLRGWFYKHQIDDIAAFIVMLERSFPGAYFYELGRDAVFLGDILDAFYLSIGQPDRVRRLDASAQSFAARDLELTYKFMATSGINLDEPTISWPHILFDVTSFNKVNGIGTGNAGSQSVQLMRAGYQHFEALHGKEAAIKLLPYFNFVSVSAFNFNFIDMRNKGYNPELHFNEQALQMQQDLIFDEPFFAELSSFTYTDAWHNYFGPFYQVGDGRVITNPGSLAAMSTRKSILRSMVSVIQTVNTPLFRAAIVREATKRGFVFPFERSSKIKFIDPDTATCEPTLK